MFGREQGVKCASEPPLYLNKKECLPEDIIVYVECDSHIPVIRHHETCLYNFDPLRPHFYIIKLGFTGVYIIFLISAQKIDCGYSLEPPR